MNRIQQVTVFVASLLLLLAVGPARGECPGMPTTQSPGPPATTYVASVFANMAPSLTQAQNFIGTGCTVMTFGSNVASCNTNNTSMFVNFIASFSSAAANNMANGCIFTCDGMANTCRVRGGDGLPVELMEFGIND